MFVQGGRSCTLSVVFQLAIVNSENYFVVQGNVLGEGPLGNVAADKLNVDLIQKKMKISMYNESKVNIKVNY